MIQYFSAFQNDHHDKPSYHLSVPSRCEIVFCYVSVIFIRSSCDRFYLARFHLELWWSAAIAVLTRPSVCLGMCSLAFLPRNGIARSQGTHRFGFSRQLPLFQRVYQLAHPPVVHKCRPSFPHSPALGVKMSPLTRLISRCCAIPTRIPADFSFAVGYLEI